jgi:phage shock protein PspC (stress-responsive transcriptional regulator)
MTEAGSQLMTPSNAPLRRSSSNRMIAGVVAGLARYIGMDVSLARILYVLISIFSAAFPGILVYVICWILIPEEEDIAL